MTTHVETRHDRRERLQARNDRNGLVMGLAGVIAFIVGMALREANPAAVLIIGLGVLGVIGGLVVRGRPVR